MTKEEIGWAYGGAEVGRYEMADDNKSARCNTERRLEDDERIC